MSIGELTSSSLTFEPEDVDPDGFISLWNIAAATVGRDPKQARHLASKMLSFLCNKRCPFVVSSTTDVEYLDEWFERDNKLLYDWSPESDRVDVITQHAHVPAELVLKFLQANKFDPTSNFNPRRAVRLAWFSDDWSVG
jgi:hypothetical protein